jgi:hypothetical protein
MELFQEYNLPVKILKITNRFGPLYRQCLSTYLSPASEGQANGGFSLTH